MGVAALQGVARSQTSTLTPFGGRPCIFATLRIEREVDRGSREQHWKIVAERTYPPAASFALDDGSVSVCPDGATFSLPTAVWHSGPLCAVEPATASGQAPCVQAFAAWNAE